MNESKKLTQEEAEHLLNMAKKSLVEGITFPEKGHDVEFEVVGSGKKDLFATRIYRGKINPTKYEIGARIKKDGIMLLELHVNPSTIHVNPDGGKIVGSHWDVYSEVYGRKQAFPADDIQSEHLGETTILVVE